jgi:methionyl aminopeptidase
VIDSRISEAFSKISRALLGKRMIIAKSKKDLDKMREAGELIAEVREKLRSMVQVGITTIEINEVALKMIKERGAIPSFVGYHGFPFAICASLNEQVVHGFSNDKPLQEGDVISIDVAASYNGFVGDTAFTAPVGKISDEAGQLLKVTEECLHLGIAQCHPNKRIGDLSYAIQSHAEKFGYGVVKDYVGHGIGRNMHEAPQIPNYGRAGTKERIRAGYCFAIEPMINMGKAETKTLADKWTVITIDGKPSAHFEHTVAVLEDGPEILTLTKEQKAALNKDKNESRAA